MELDLGMGLPRKVRTNEAIEYPICFYAPVLTPNFCIPECIEMYYTLVLDVGMSRNSPKSSIMQLKVQFEVYELVKPNCSACATHRDTSNGADLPLYVERVFTMFTISAFKRFRKLETTIREILNFQSLSRVRNASRLRMTCPGVKTPKNCLYNSQTIAKKMQTTPIFQ